MDLHCPNCGAALAVPEPVSSEPVSCGTCEKAVYLPQEGHFPAIVPLTFASQASAPVPLLPFFHAELVRLPPELDDNQTQLTPAPTFAPGEGGHETPPPGDETGSRMAEHQEESLSVDPASLTVGAADLPTVEVEPPPADLEAVPEDLPTVDSEPLEELPMVAVEPVDDALPAASPSPEDMQLLSLAGGSFAAALTPPPSSEQVAVDPGLGGMAGLGPAPWDTNGGGARGNGQEQWSVGAGAPPPAAGPPPLGPPKLTLPPPVPKKGSVDEIALALGLPQLEERPPQAPPPALLVSSAAEEELTEKRSRRHLFIIGGIVLVVSAVIAVFVVSRATRELDTPLETKAPQAASLPEKPPETVKDEPKIDAKKRAQAIELYNKGNKLYLQKKYKEAEAEYKKALEMDEGFALAHRGLGVTYAQQDKSQKAIEAYKSYLKLAPDAKDAPAVRKIIKEAEQQK